MLTTTADGQFLSLLIIWKGSASKSQVFKTYTYNLDRNISVRLEEKWRGKIDFAQNAKAWMTTSLFADYLSRLFPKQKSNIFFLLLIQLMHMAIVAKKVSF